METTTPDWMKALGEEDWQFLKRFLLSSGSLKALAVEYGVSYPTLRNRLVNTIRGGAGSREPLGVMQMTQSSFEKPLNLIRVLNTSTDQKLGQNGRYACGPLEREDARSADPSSAGGARERRAVDIHRRIEGDHPGHN